MDHNKILQAHINEILTKWDSFRFAHVKRAYSAEDVAKLKGTFMTADIKTYATTYPSDVQAKKLWNILKAHQSKKTASVTFGALDPIQAIQMAKYTETIYVSGWQCSSTASSTNGTFSFFH